MPEKLEFLDNFWDPGRVKVLADKKMGDTSVHIITVQHAPHFQRVVIKPFKWGVGDSQTYMLNMPMPYLYYYIRATANDKGYVSAKMQNIGCSTVEADLRTQPICTLPLPNTGSQLYTCAPSGRLVSPGKKGKIVYEALSGSSETLKEIVVDEVAKAAVIQFWNQRFRYHEAFNEAHIELYDWAAIKRPINHSVVPTVYEKWAKLRLKDLPEQPWLKHVDCPSLTKKWVPID